MKLLGVNELQPPVSAYDIGNGGLVANFGETTANPYPKLPDLLTFNDVKKVMTAAQWKKRRTETAALFDEERLRQVPRTHTGDDVDDRQHREHFSLGSRRCCEACDRASG